MKKVSLARCFHKSSMLFAEISVTDKIGYDLFAPISNHVINPLIKYLLLSGTSFVPC